MVPTSWSLRSLQAREDGEHLVHVAGDLRLVVADVGAHLQVSVMVMGEHAAALPGTIASPCLTRSHGPWARGCCGQVFDVALVDRQRCR